MSAYKKPIDLTPCAPRLIAVHYSDPDYKACVESQKLLCDDLWSRYQNHERLVEALAEVVTCFNCPEWSDRCEEVEAKARDLLAALEAEKGGEL